MIQTRDQMTDTSAFTPADARARYRRILRFAARALVQTWWFELALPRVGLVSIANRTRASRMMRIARRYHGLAVDLGGLMIKLGQFMSSRLDVLPPEQLADAIALQDKASISRANGVGQKLAARIVQELSGKPGPKGSLTASSLAPRGAASVSGARAEAVSALVNLGIDQSSAARAVANAAKQFDAAAPAPELIRAALKEVSR